MKPKSILRLLCILMLSNAATGTFSQTTAFTYQGRLNDRGAAANGDYDLRFVIYDAPTEGNAVGSPITTAPVGVTNGLFTVTLDFGAGIFDGSARWLELGVRTNGNTESHVILSPRQPLTSAPYAVRAVTAGTAASVSGMVPAAQITGSVPASQIGAGTISSAVMFDNPGNLFNGVFAGNGAGLNQLALQSFTNFPPSLIPLLNPPLLNGATNYAVGNNPHAVLAADVNADGKPDLITADQNTGTLTVLTNAGKGTFLLAASPTVGNQPLGVAAGDVNGDGRVDLISANYGGNSLTILANNGNGTFGTPATLSVGVHPYSVVAADLNGDSTRDLVCANEGSGTLTVLTNNGSGMFTVASSPTVGSKPQFVIVADVDADGRPDLIAANHDSGTLTVLANSGNGTFGVKNSPAVGASPSSVTTLDVNADGKPDLVSANGYANTLTVLTNNGDGTFTVGATLSPGGNPQSVAAADVNGDGRPDLVSANLGDNTLTALINKGDGTFAPVASPAVGGAPISVVAADLNSDGRVDLVAANLTANSVSVLLARPDPLTLLATGNGAGLTNLSILAGNVTGTLAVGSIPDLDATKITSGTVSDARLSANVALLGTPQTFTAAKVFNNAGNVFNGTFIGDGGGADEFDRAPGRVGGGHAQRHGIGEHRGPQVRNGA